LIGVLSVALVAVLAGGPQAAADGGSGVPTGGMASGGVDPTLKELTAMVGAEAGALGGGGGGGSGPPCTWTPAQNVADQPLAEPTRVDPDGIRSVLYVRECVGSPPALVWVRQASPRELADRAFETVQDRVPSPRGVFSPELGGAVVHLPLWFAVRDGQWAPVSASASIPGLTAVVIATPLELVFEPGDGSSPVACVGPGPKFRPGMREPASPPACAYAYRDASSIAPDGRAWPASLSIRWEVTWSATTGAGGALGALTTTAAYAMPVGEIQAIEQASVR
jgi:hypothetical protein